MHIRAKGTGTRFAYSQPDRRFRGGAYDYIRVADALPTYEQIADVADPLCKVKLFLPASRFTYYVAALTDYDGTPVLSGYCVSALDPRFDAFEDASLREIASVRSAGLPAERDLYFSPLRVSEIEARLQAGHTP